MSVLNQDLAIYRFFEQLCAIPHGSYNEGAVADWLVEFAKARSLSFYRDDMNNVILRKPASAGYESHAPVMLQAHTDMVCEKNADSAHDFSSDPLELFVEDGWLRARGTTLGGDDGQGVAMMLAILDDDTLAHPPLECVFTVQEEVGLCGAMHLDASQLTAKRMVNLDSDGETVTLVSSSGGMRAHVEFDGETQENAAPSYRLFLTGLRGGHSGGFIHKGLGNANRIACRIFEALLRRGFKPLLCEIHGGLKENAIPRECELIFACAGDPQALTETIEAERAAVAAELGAADPGLQATLTPISPVARTLTEDASARLIRLGFLLPNGLQAMSPDIPDLPVISLNLGRFTLENGHASFLFSIRSPMDTARRELFRRIEDTAALLGAAAAVSNDYPGWAYEKNSPLREALRAVFARHGMTLTEAATHGGLETGVLKGKIPALDIVTFGALAEDIHTPAERLNLASCERCYGILTELLADL